MPAVPGSRTYLGERRHLSAPVTTVLDVALPISHDPSAAPVRANLALYRKYRSATFAEVIGQEHVTEPLSIALNAGRINHAYLFSGPRGCGKTSSARILARSLNCAQGPTATPCGVCDSCRELAPNGPGSIDVIEIDAASHGGVDDARDLRERAFFSPVRDRFKVYIIDEAHMVTTQGFNALLKVIEEPPEFLVFIFATTEPDKVLQTIRSRTHHYPFRLVPPGTLRAHLERICAAEDATIEQAVYPLVVRAGGGSVRDSLSLLDQLLAGAGPEGVTYRRATALLGVTDEALLDAMIDALAVSDAASVYGTIDRVVEAGHEPRRFAADLLDRLRDLLILDAVPDAATNGLLDVPEDALNRMRDQAIRIGSASAARYAEIVHTALTDMRGTTAPRLVLELVCARMLLPDASADSAALLQRLERLERRAQLSAAEGGPVESVHSVARAPEPAPVERRPPPARAATTYPSEPAQVPSAMPQRLAAAADSTKAGQPRRRDAADAAPAADRAAAACGNAPTAAPAAPRAEPNAKSAEPRATPAEPKPAAAPLAATAPAKTAAAPLSPVPPSPAPTTPAAGGVLDVRAIRDIWPEVLDKIKTASRRTRALMESVQVAGLDGSQLRLTISSAPLARLLKEPANTDVVVEALGGLIAGKWTVAVDVAGETPSPPAPRAAAPKATQTPATPVEEENGAWPMVKELPAAEAVVAAKPKGRVAAESNGPAEPTEDDFSEGYPDEDTGDYSDPSAPRLDPEAEALLLLKTGLGASPVD
jgi:DNA polymerase-3 subunit gamma/tau